MDTVSASLHTRHTLRLHGLPDALDRTAGLAPDDQHVWWFASAPGTDRWIAVDRTDADERPRLVSRLEDPTLVARVERLGLFFGVPWAAVAAAPEQVGTSQLVACQGLAAELRTEIGTPASLAVVHAVRDLLLDDAIAGREPLTCV